MEGICKAASIENLRRQIVEWRKSKRKLKQHRMPEELWCMAAELARKHGVSRVAEELGLGYTNLKNRLATGAATIKRGTEAAGGGFVELVNLAGCGQMRVEVSRPDGCQMRIELGAGLGADVAPVVRAFLG